MLLLTRGYQSPKIAHGDLSKYEARILHLLPHQEGGFNTTVCPWSSPGCRATCLNYAGRGQTNRVHEGRWKRTKWYHTSTSTFIAQLDLELRRLADYAYRQGKKACARLDGTSDLGLAVMFAQAFPSIQFYDYTKSVGRYKQWLLDYPHFNRYNNRYLTFSKSELTQHATFQSLLDQGGNITVVFNVKQGHRLPLSYLGYPLIDGDRHDFRFLDPPGHVVGLRAKGIRARRDKTGFVVQV